MENQNEESRKSWGGARSGCGRKKTTVKALTFRITQEALDVLAEAKEAGFAQAEYINAAICANRPPK